MAIPIKTKISEKLQEHEEFLLFVCFMASSISGYILIHAASWLRV
jgi:hypothetical protein